MKTQLDREIANSLLRPPFHSTIEMQAFWEMYKEGFFQEYQGGYLVFNLNEYRHFEKKEDAQAMLQDMERAGKISINYAERHTLLVDIQKERIAEEERKRPASQLKSDQLALKLT